MISIFVGVVNNILDTAASARVDVGPWRGRLAACRADARSAYGASHNARDAWTVTIVVGWYFKGTRSRLVKVNFASNHH